MHMCGTALDVGRVSNDKNEAFPTFYSLEFPVRPPLDIDLMAAIE